MIIEFGSVNMLTYTDEGLLTMMLLTFPLSIKVAILRVLKIIETKPIDQKVISLRKLHIFYLLKTNFNGNFPEI